MLTSNSLVSSHSTDTEPHSHFSKGNPLSPICSLAPPSPPPPPPIPSPPSVLGTSALLSSSHRHHSQYCTHQQCAYHAPSAHQTTKDTHIASSPLMHAHSPSTPIASSSSGTRNSKLEHIIQNFYTKTAQVIVQARIDVESSHKEKKNSHGRKINKWFNVVTEDIESLREELKHWRRLSVRYGEEEPPPMVLDLYLDTSEIRRGQVLVAVDDNLQRHRVDLGMHGSQEVHRILVETWVLTLNHPLPDTPVDLPNLYKRSIIFFRSLHSLVRLLPGHSLQQRLKDTSGAGLSLKYRLSSSLQHSSDEIALSQPIMSGDMQNQTQTYDFSDIVTPLGTLKLQLYYRKSCDFQIENVRKDRHEPSVDIEENYFTPTMARHHQEQHLSSLPSASSMDQERHKGATEPRAIRHSATETQLQGGAGTFQRTSPPLPDPSSSTTTPRDRKQSTMSRTPLASSPLSRDSLGTRNLHPSPVEVAPLGSSISRRVSVSLVSPFKSPSLSSSPQAELMFSSPRANPSPGDKARRIEFSSSFEKYKERSSPNRGDTGSMSMMRRWSRTSDHSSTHREEEDADLEEFMRLVGTKQELKLFQGKTSASGITDHSSMSEISDSMGTSGFGSGSVLRSKKALSHFRTLKETHNTLSESLSCSFVATDATGHEGHQPTVGTSLGSSASSSSRSYMPVVPSPLHTEQAPMSPVHIPSGQSYGSNVSHLVNARQHRRHHSTHHSADQQSHPIETSSEQIAFSSYPKDRQVELRRLSAMKDDEGETHTTRRGGVVPHSSLPQYSTRRHLSPEDLELFPSDIDRTTSQTSLNDTRIRGSTVESSGSRHGDRTSLLDDDDSLVFKMSELGYESPCSHSMAVHSPAEATRGHMSGGMNSGMMGGMMGGNGGRENEGGIVLHCPLTDTRHYARRWSTSISPSLQRMPTSPTQPTLSKEKKSPSSSEHDYSKEIKRTTDRHSTEESLAGHNSFYRDW